MINMTAAALLSLGLSLHVLGGNHTLLAAIGIIFAMAFFLLMYLQYPILFVGSARYPLARKCFPLVRWAIFAIYFADLSTTLMGYLGGPQWGVSVHAYSIWAGVYLVVYSLAILTGPPKRRRRRKILPRYRWRQWEGQLVPIPISSQRYPEI
ncbi:hypothetical protein [Nodosilinea nodulosa]|uniref:hypothetical protein n=1 Tax=Nodosilinea nodulosa TaxID=416001 RepID=UPI0003082C24|nr:hypothetical protein [Nodosilinea nodulosa]